MTAFDLRGVRVLLVDIEGTTTPVTFVADVLFPYARVRLRAYLGATHQGESRGALAKLRDEYTRESPNSAPDVDALVQFAESLMDRDVKSPGLKELQGLIWRSGYDSGELSGDVFDDVPVAFDAAIARGMRVAIYSSGSVLAQQLLFGSTRFGDLRPGISAWFDTAVGAKRDSASFAHIARRLECAPSEILFVSDIPAELEAARVAGLRTALAVRPGNAPASTNGDSPTVRRLTDLF